jgi:hypothetical protein
MAATPGPTGQAADSVEKLPLDDASSGQGSVPRQVDGRGAGQSMPSPPPRGVLTEGQGPRRTRTVETHASAPRSGIDWIVPVEEKGEPVSVSIFSQ